jgi:hypothetical protein
MSRVDDKHSRVFTWAAWAGIVAVFLAALAIGRDYFGTEYSGKSSDPPTAPTAPTNDRPTPPADLPDTRVTESPPAAAPTTPTEVPADSLPDEEDQQEAAKSTPANPGAITVATILPGDSGQIGPTKWRAGKAPGFSIEVYTAAGKVQARDACFVSWSLINDDGETRVTESSRCASGGITPFSPGSLKVGDSMVTAEITTEWDAKAQRKFTFTVVP